jgi:TRAP-type uncharacterized transport system fused permease subunit
MTQGQDRSVSASRAAFRGWLILALAAGAAGFHLWAAGVSPFTALVQRPIHLAFMAFLGFLGLGVQASRSKEEAVLAEADPGAVRDAPAGLAMGAVLAWVLAALSLLSFLYLAVENRELVLRSGTPTALDLTLGALAVVLVIELARRTTGWGLVVVSLLALAYAFLGPWLPGVLAHRG